MMRSFIIPSPAAAPNPDKSWIDSLVSRVAPKLSADSDKKTRKTARSKSARRQSGLATDYQSLEPRKMLAGASEALIEFDTSFTTGAENAGAAGDGPTVIVRGDLSGIESNALRTIEFSTLSGSEITSNDVTLTNPSLVIPAGDYSVNPATFNLIQTGNITVTNDTWLEGNEEFSISMFAWGSALTPGDADNDLSTRGGATHDILDDEVGVVRIVEGQSIDESGTNSNIITELEITGSGSGPLQVASNKAINVQVQWNGEGISHESGDRDDFDFTSQAISFPGGTASGTQQIITASAIDDTRIEGEEYFGLELVNTGDLYDGQVTLGDAEFIAITDNDTGTITFDELTSTASESRKLIRIRVDMTGGSTELENGIAVGIQDLGTGTTVAADYTSDFTGRVLGTSSGLVQPGTVIGTMLVDFTADSLVERHETLNLEMGSLFPLDELAGEFGDLLTVINGGTHEVTVLNTEVSELAISSVSVQEDAGTATITVTSDNGVDGGFDVDVTAAALTAEGSDFSFSTQTLSFTGLVDETQTFVVNLVDDNIVEVDETIQLSMMNVVTSVAFSHDVIDDAVGIVTVTNDDVATISIGNFSATEGEPATLSVSVDNAVEGGFSLDFSPLFEGTGSPGDVNQASGTVTFNGDANESQTFEVTFNDDNVVEGDEEFEIQFSNPQGEVASSDIIHADVAGVTIVDNDLATLSVDDVLVNESAGIATVVVRLDLPIQGGFTVDYETTLGTAEAGDFTSVSGELTFVGNAAETQSFDVAIVNDDIVEAMETINVVLSNVQAGQASDSDVDASDGAVISVENDDIATFSLTSVTGEEGQDATVAVSIDKAVEGGVTINLGVSHGSTSPGDVTLSQSSVTFVGDANESVDVTVVRVDDNIVEETESATVGITGVTSNVWADAFLINNTGTVSVEDNDTAEVFVENIVVDEASGQAVVIVTLSNPVENGFDIDYVTATDGTATAADFTSVDGTLSFVGLEGETQSFVVPVNSDEIVEDEETFEVGLTGVSNVEADTQQFDLVDGVVSIRDDDLAVLTVVETNVNEGGSVEVTVQIDKAVEGGFTVDYSSADGNLASSADYTSISGTLEFVGNINEQHTFTVSALTDDIVEGDETIIVTLADVTPEEAPSTSFSVEDRGIITIVDNDIATLSIGDLTVDEDQGVVSVSIAVDKAVQGGFGVNYGIASGTADAETDSSGASGTLIFTGAANEMIQFTFSVTDDEVVEADEVLTALINSVIPEQAMPSDFDFSDTGSILINDNDMAELTIEDIVVDETSGTASVVVSVDNAVQGGFSVTAATLDGTAVGGSDFVTTTSTLTFAGDVSETQTFTVSILNDNRVEADKAFSVGLFGVVADQSNATSIDAMDTGAVGLTDEDTTAVTVEDVVVDESGTALLTVTLSNPVEDGFVVGFDSMAIGDTDETDFTQRSGSLNFVGLEGETATVSFELNDDNIVEGNEQFQFLLTGLSEFGVQESDIDISDSATVTITNNDSAALTVNDVVVDESNGTATVNVTLSNTIQGGFTIDVATESDTTSAGDFTPSTQTLTFEGAANESHEFTISITDDDVVEGLEGINIVLSNLTPTQAEPVAVDFSDVGRIQISNDDSAALLTSNVDISESAGMATVTVTLDADVEGGFTVDFGTSGETAADSDDFTGVSGTLTFAGNSGETQSFMVSLENDLVVEGDEIIVVNLGNVQPAEASAEAFDVGDSGQIKILDNDFANVSVQSVTVNEDIGTVDVVVQADAAVQGGFAVDFATADDGATGGDYTGTSGTLTFFGNVLETQTFTLEITNDLTLEGTERLDVSLSGFEPVEASAEVFSAENGHVEITDNDSAVISIADTSVDEGEGTVTISVSIDNAVEGGFSVDVSRADGTAGSGLDHGTISETLDFEGVAGETVTFTVLIEDDAIVEANENFMLQLGNVSVEGPNAEAFDISALATTTIFDDDFATLSVEDVSIDESAGTATVTVSVDSAVQGGFAVDFGTEGFTGESGVDYLEATGTLQFVGTAEETQTFIISIVEDDVVEGDEIVNVGLFNVTPAEADSRDFDASDTADVVIENNDIATVTVQSAVVDESVGFATVIVAVDKAVQDGFEIGFETFEGTAGLSDFVNSSGSLFFNGVVNESQSFQFAVVDDFVVEADETVIVTLGDASSESISSESFDTSSEATITINNNETAIVTVTDVSIEEGDESITVEVTVDKAIQGGFEVSFGTEALTATAGSDFVAASGGLNFFGSAGETQTFSIDISEDSVVEAFEQFQIVLSELEPEEVDFEDIDVSDTGVLTIENDDMATVTVTDVAVNEDAGTATVTVSLDNQVEGGVAVQIVTSSGSATSGADGSSNGSVEFNGSGDESISFEININNDDIVEGTEILDIGFGQIESAAPVNAFNLTDTAEVTITDNDNAVVSVLDVSVNEDTGLATVTVQVDKAVEGGFTVDFATSALTASGSGEDYTGSTGTLTFAGTVGEQQTFEFGITNDDIVESLETVQVALSNVIPAEASTEQFDATDTGEVTIVDNDVAVLTVGDVTVNEATGLATVTVQVNKAVEGGFSVDYATSALTATGGGEDYSPSVGTLTFAGELGEQQTFFVQINEDNVVEGLEKIQVTLSDVVPGEASPEQFDASDIAEIKIEDNDTAVLTVADVTVNEDTGTATVSVQVGNAVEGGFSVDFSTAGVTAAGQNEVGENEDFVENSGTLEFTGTINEIVTFDVTINDDDVLEGLEQLQVTLSNVTPAEASSEQFDDSDTALVSITDNDNAVVTVSDVTVDEAAGTATITVTVDKAVQGGFTIDVESSEMSANAELDFASFSSKLVFAGEAGESQTLTVDIVDDATVEANELIGVSLPVINPQEADPSAFDISDTAVVTVNDNDTATITVEDVEVNEDAGTATVTITVDNAVQGGFDVNYSTLGITADEGADFTGVDGTLEFSGDAGEQTTVEITINEDEIVEGYTNIEFELSELSADQADVGNISIPENAEIGIVDNDNAVLTIEDVTVNEDSGLATVTVTVDKAVQGGFEVDFATSGVTATAGVDYVGNSGTLTFDGTVGEQQQFSFLVTEDAAVEAAEFVAVALSNLNPVEADVEQFDATDTGQVSITNNDTATLTVEDVLFREESGDAIVTVSVDNPVDGGFTVDFQTLAGTATGAVDFDAGTGTLQFAGLENETQTFAIAVSEDSDVETNETISVLLANLVASQVGSENIDAQDTATVTIIDDESLTQVGEAGTATAVTQDWKTITLNREFVNPVVIAGPLSTSGTDTAVARVRNVTSNSFEIRVDEWDHLDGFHFNETIGYLVVEAGTHQLPDGTVFTAGNQEVGVSLTEVISSNDGGIVLATVVTENDPAAVTPRVSNEGGTFFVKVQEEEGADQVHANETVSWIQFSAGTGEIGGFQYEATMIDGGVDHNSKVVHFAQSFEQTPVLLAGMQSNLGFDTISVRRQNLNASNMSLFLEEERSKDAEIFHLAEEVGFLALSEGAIEAVTANDGKVGENGVLSLDHNWMQVNFSQPYSNPVVMMGAVTQFGGDGVVARVRNVTSTGFEARIQEWDSLDGLHAPENVAYLVMEAGVHVLEDGTTVSAGLIEGLDHEIERIEFPNEFEGTPVVLTQVVSENESSSVLTRQRNINSLSFEVRLQEQEADFEHAPETVSWIAIDEASGQNQGRLFEAGTTGDVVGHTPETLAFVNDYGTAPALFAQMQTFDGSDPSNVRFRNLDGNGARVFIQEETSADSELEHTEENVGYFVFQPGSIFKQNISASRFAPSDNDQQNVREGNNGGSDSYLANNYFGQSEFAVQGMVDLGTSSILDPMKVTETRQPQLRGAVQLETEVKDAVFADLLDESTANTFASLETLLDFDA